MEMGKLVIDKSYFKLSGPQDDSESSGSGSSGIPQEYNLHVLKELQKALTEAKGYEYYDYPEEEGTVVEKHEITHEVKHSNSESFKVRQKNRWRNLF